MLTTYPPQYDVTAICIFALVIGCLPPKTDIHRIFIVWHLVQIWKSCIFYYKYVYEFAVHSLFCANSKYADEFQMNMAHDDIGTCLPWRLLWWTRPTPYLPSWVQHGHGASALDNNALPLDLVAKKLDWLVAELEILSWVWLLHSDMKHWKYWIIYLQASPHRLALTEGKNTHRGNVHEEVAAGGLMRWNWVFIGCRYIFLRFWIYLALSGMRI